MPTAQFNANFMSSFQNGSRRANVIRQGWNGEGGSGDSCRNAGFWGFNSSAINSTLDGMIIDSIKMTMTSTDWGTSSSYSLSIYKSPYKVGTSGSMLIPDDYYPQGDLLALPSYFSSPEFLRNDTNTFDLPFDYLEHIKNGYLLACYRRTSVNTPTVSHYTREFTEAPILTITYHAPVSSFTLSTTSLEAGQTITANISRADSTYHHTVIFKLGTATQTYTNVATSQAFTIPLTGDSSWLYQMPNTTSGTASCVVKTYNSSGALMGEAPARNFTVIVPTSIKPTLTTLTPTLVNGYWGLYVQGYSSVTLTASGGVGAYGSTISSSGYFITGKGTSPITIGPLGTSGGVLQPDGTYKFTFDATVTDSRNRTSNPVSCSIYVTPYSPPKVSSLIVERASDSSGTLFSEGMYCKITPTYTWSLIGSNALTMNIEYRDMTTSTWVPGSTSLVSSGGYIVLGSGNTFAVDRSYEIRVTIDDGVSNPVPFSATLYTAKYIVDFKAGGNGIAFGGVSLIDDAVEVIPEWELYYKGETLDGRFGQIKTYNSPSQIGITLSDTTTLEQVVSAMPDNSRIVFMPNNSTTSNLSPSSERYGIVEIIKFTNYRTSAWFHSTNHNVWKNDVYNGTPSTWKRLISDGDSLTSQLTMPRIRLTSTTDASGTADNEVALIIGDRAGAHLAMDGNEIMAKASGTSVASLILNPDGGDVYVNQKKVWHEGSLKYMQGATSVTISTAGTTVNTTIDLSSAGFTSAPSVVATVRTSAPGVFAVSTATPTTTSVTIYLYRSSGTGTSYISWVAIGT